MTHPDYPHLFSPIRIGNFTVENRICHLAPDLSSAHADGSVSPRVIRYHEQTAQGGCGLIIVGGATPDRATGRATVTCLALDEDPLIPALAELAEAMHRHGARCAVQIRHPGRLAAWPRKGLMSASDQVVALPGAAGREVAYAEEADMGRSVRAMTVDDIYELVEKFGEAAWRVRQAGFDAVELDGAHGCLIAQFMSPSVNRRNDRFGGSLANRVRLLLEIVDRIQRKCGKDYPIGVRYSGEEWVEGGRTLEESVKVAQLLAPQGVAFLDISAGTMEAPAAVMGPMYYPEGWNTRAAEAIKRHVWVPVITSHTLRDPAYCERLLAEGRADMVGLSRQMIADPRWANKARMRQPEEIRKCISCLTGCWQESLVIQRHLRCAVNPAVGDERFLELPAARQKMRVAVVGGGPGGMEAARIATLRGHQVSIFERSGELGGAMLYCCAVPAKEKMRWYADWLRRQIGKLGVEVRFRTAPGVEQLQGFDAVILATGGKVRQPAIPGIRHPFVLTFEELLRCGLEQCEYHLGDRPRPAACGGTVLIWGDHFAATGVAERLGSDGKKVYLVTENPELASWMEPCHRDVMLRRFAGGNGEGLRGETYAQAVTVMVSTTVTEIAANGEVTLLDDRFRQTRVRVDNVVLGAVEPAESPYEALLAAGVPAVRIGDHKRVRNLRAAVREGAHAGLSLEGGWGLNANLALI